MNSSKLENKHLQKIILTYIHKPLTFTPELLEKTRLLLYHLEHWYTYNDKIVCSKNYENNSFKKVKYYMKRVNMKN